ncbi:MAG: SDR family oxidoreductase [Desulfamplus sp.]|nr:SDR family oxidoreductase [Desulfamplus sp.]
MKKNVLITGSTGYVGRRLKQILINQHDLNIRLMVRDKNRLDPSILAKERQEELQIVEADTFDPKSLEVALQNIDVAFYLIHSMGSKDGDFKSKDRISAENFRDASIAAGVKRVIYLGGLGAKESASSHLLSRIETGEILSAHKDKIQTIWFRAGVVIGSGSASFEIVRHLIHKLPIMITPKWVNTITQPIAIDDVLAYLHSAIYADIKGDLIVDIGSAPMSFGQMMQQTAKVMGLERILIPVPLLTPKLSSYWLILFTPVPLKMAAALIEGLKSETILLNDNAQRYFSNIKPMPFNEAVKRAIDEMEHREVISRWCDSSEDKSCELKELDSPAGVGESAGAVLRDIRKFSIGKISKDRLFASICSLGGENGWFAFNFLWEIRGVIDKLSGGVGLNRGKRSTTNLRVGDAVDFWKVADIKDGKRLLLAAQMKLPGKAWLEFDIQSEFGVMVQIAHFHPRGLLGRVYWYSMLPVHNIIFKMLGQKIVEHATTKGGPLL